MSNSASRGATESEPPVFRPHVTIPAITIPLPDGSYQIKPGRPVIEQQTISTRHAAQLLGLSASQVRRLVEAGLLTAERPGKRWLRIHLAAVLQRKAGEV